MGFFACFCRLYVSNSTNSEYIVVLAVTLLPTVSSANDAEFIPVYPSSVGASDWLCGPVCSHLQFSAVSPVGSPVGLRAPSTLTDGVKQRTAVIRVHFP